MRGGRPPVFISIDDGTRRVDSVFFHEAQELAGPLLFGTRLLLIRGNTRRTGPRGISISATMAWDLSRPETLPFPEKQAQDQLENDLQMLGPLDGISRSLAITGLGG
jgi:error-prone DNA polymerase